MEAFEAIYIHIITAALYFYHLGEWIYRMDNFNMGELKNYPADVMFITYTYVFIISALLVSGICLTSKKPQAQKVAIAFTFVAAIYELVRLKNILQLYGSVDPELFQAHLGIRLSFIVLVGLCCYQT